MFKNGVYIGKDIEVVITDKYIISYRRSNNFNFLESNLLKKDLKTSEYRCIGICQTSPTETDTKIKPDKWNYAFFDGKSSFTSDKKTSDFLGQTILKAENNNGTFTYYDDTSYETVQDEDFTMNDLKPIPTIANKNNIGECLKIWNMGIMEEIININGNDTFIGVMINTEKHMYIFEMLPSSIYCRVARYRTCNKGVVFNQNFRQGPNGYMVSDNKLSLQALPINESLFCVNACSWDDRSVYWSLACFTENQIILNGCEGKPYKWNKPDR